MAVAMVAAAAVGHGCRGADGALIVSPPTLTRPDVVIWAERPVFVPRREWQPIVPRI